MEPKSTSALRAVAEGAAFQLAFTALAFGALEAWARVCEARRTHRLVP
jgi:hypothetical protein